MCPGGSGRFIFVVFYVSGRLWEAHLYVFYVSGRLWEAHLYVFYVSRRLWEAHLYVFYVSRRLEFWFGKGGRAAQAPKSVFQV